LTARPAQRFGTGTAVTMRAETEAARLRRLPAVILLFRMVEPPFS
jgi:hypothetical protein